MWVKFNRAWSISEDRVFSFPILSFSTHEYFVTVTIFGIAISVLYAKPGGIKKLLASVGIAVGIIVYWAILFIMAFVGIFYNKIDITGSLALGFCTYIGGDFVQKFIKRLKN